MREQINGFTHKAPRRVVSVQFHSALHHPDGEAKQDDCPRSKQRPRANKKAKENGQNHKRNNPLE